MCSCNKKRLVAVGAPAAAAPTPFAMTMAASTMAIEVDDATVWGPALWSILHCLAFKTGRSGNQRVDGDEARYFEILIDNLCNVLPCSECQNHCREYLLGPGRLHRWRSIYGEDLRNGITTWFSNFHNAVRIRQGKEPMYNVDYSGCTITEETMNLVDTNMKNAVTLGLVNVTYLRRWTRNLTELKLLLAA